MSVCVLHVYDKWWAYLNSLKIIYWLRYFVVLFSHEELSINGNIICSMWRAEMYTWDSLLSKIGVNRHDFVRFSLLTNIYYSIYLVHNKKKTLVICTVAGKPFRKFLCWYPLYSLTSHEFKLSSDDAVLFIARFFFAPFACSHQKFHFHHLFMDFSAQNLGLQFMVYLFSIQTRNEHFFLNWMKSSSAKLHTTISGSSTSISLSA